jgi:hypothetical protein
LGRTRAIVVDHRFTHLGAEPIRRFMATWQHPGGVAPSTSFSAYLDDVSCEVTH